MAGIPTDWRRFRSYLRRLRRAALTSRPFRVRFVPASRIHLETGCDAVGSYGDGTIHIDCQASEAVAIDTLIHEYAHHLSLSHRHGDKYWKSHGRVYRAIHGDS